MTKPAPSNGLLWICRSLKLIALGAAYTVSTAAPTPPVARSGGEPGQTHLLTPEQYQQLLGPAPVAAQVPGQADPPNATYVYHGQIGRPLYATYTQGPDRYMALLPTYQDGTPEAVLRSRNGKLHGIQTEWYPDGTRKSEKTYADGKLEGNLG